MRLVAEPRCRRPSRRGFRIAIILASVIAAIVGSLLLATRDSGEEATTRGVTATLQVAGHPGWTAGPDALWLALSRDPPTGRRSASLRLDLASGVVAQTVYLGGRAFHLAHYLRRADGAPRRGPVDLQSGTRLRRVRGDELVALDWRSGVVLVRRGFDGPVDHLVPRRALWALEVRPGTLFRLDPGTLAPTAPPLCLFARSHP